MPGRKPRACRQSGSSCTDDLVIVAHNYDNHFGRLKELSKGDTVIFTDMEGLVNTYFVEKLETLGPDAVDTIPAPRVAGRAGRCSAAGQRKSPLLSVPKKQA